MSNLGFPTMPLGGGGTGITSLANGNYTTVTNLGGGVWKTDVNLDALKADLLTRPIRQIWVGAALSGTVTPDGSAQAPYADIADAITWMLTQPADVFEIKCSPETYSDFTWPAGYSGVIDCLTSGAAVANLTLEPFAGPVQTLTMRGFSIGAVDTSAAANPTDTAKLRIERDGTIGTVSNTGGADLYIEAVGSEEPVRTPAAVSITGAMDLGAGLLTVTVDRADVQADVNCTSYMSTDSRNPETLAATYVSITEAEDDQGFHGTPAITASSTVSFDQITAQRFAVAGGTLTGGAGFGLVNDGAWAPGRGKVALSAGTPVYTIDDAGTLKLRIVDATEAALRVTFAGFCQLTTGADGDPQLVVGNGGRAFGIAGAINMGAFSALVPRKAYYAAGITGTSLIYWLLFSEDDLAAFTADVPAGTFYRLIGVADSTTSILQGWEDATFT